MKKYFLVLYLLPSPKHNLSRTHKKLDKRNKKSKENNVRGRGVL